MREWEEYRKQIEDNGFAVIHDVFSKEEIEMMLKGIEDADTSGDTFRKSEDLFAIRQFLKGVPEVRKSVFNSRLTSVIQKIFGNNYFVVKSIYFDKPESSNWYVAYHQDLTISVDRKADVEGFGSWTTKQNQFGVQPPLEVLDNMFTIRIHLDDTDEYNGALKVIPGSHAKGIYRPETIDWTTEKEVICKVKKGSVMIMKPLLLHGSNRTTNGKRRRVIHIEFPILSFPAAFNGLKK